MKSIFLVIILLAIIVLENVFLWANKRQKTWALWIKDKAVKIISPFVWIKTKIQNMKNKNKKSDI